MRQTKCWYQLPYNPKLRRYAKELRQAGNLSEVLFWNKVKRKQFLGFDFDRQKIIGNYIVDFFCVDKGVVIEIDGSSHNDKGNYDIERDLFLESLGLIVIRIPVKDIMQNMMAVLRFLEHHPAFSEERDFSIKSE